MNNYRSKILLLIFTIIIRHILCEISATNCSIRDELYTFSYKNLSESDITIDDEQSKEKITLRLCSPLSQNCSGRSGYSICLTKNGEEKGIGKFPPRSDKVGTQNLVFDGDRCDDNRNYTVIIIMKCDYSVTGRSKPVIIPSDGNSCIRHMIWHTIEACIEAKKTNCTVVDDSKNTYDLSSLTATSDNHVTYVGNSNNDRKKMIINVCQSVIYEHGAHCQRESAACLEDSSNSSDVRYDDYGDVSGPLFIDNGTLKIVYNNGKSCVSKTSLLQNHRTTISFICDPEATENTEPKFMNESEPCDTKFSWKTALACNQTYLNDYKKINENKCTVTDPRTKYRYDLKTLMEKDFVINGTSGPRYKFRICSPLTDDKFTQRTGILRINDSTSAGTDNTNLTLQHGGPYLNYTDGATCGDNQKRYTIIAFVCGAEGSLNLPVIVKDEPCYLIIHWYTDLVCRNRTVCATAKNETNLRPLIQTTENYVVKTADSEFQINVCRPVTPTSNLACPHGSSACKAVKNSKDQYAKEISLGFPDDDPIRIDNDNVMLNYQRGSPCPEYPEKNISSSLKFICDYNGDRGKPEFKDYSNCHYVFEWKTNIVCSAVVGNMVSPCTVKDPSNSREVDLSLLYEKPVPRLVIGKEKNYSVSICGGEKYCNGSAVCQQTNGYGTFSTVIFDYSNKVIRLQYLNGNKCLTNSYASEVSLICNSTAGIGEPMLISDANCTALFKWHTKVACAEETGPIIPISVLTVTAKEDSLVDPTKNDTATQTWLICGMLIVVIMVIGIWLYLRNPRRCVHLRSRITAITATRNHSRVQYSRVNTTEEARLLLDTTDTSVDGQIDSDEELLGV